MEEEKGSIGMALAYASSAVGSLNSYWPCPEYPSAKASVAQKVGQLAAQVDTFLEEHMEGGKKRKGLLETQAREIAQALLLIGAWAEEQITPLNSNEMCAIARKRFTQSLELAPDHIDAMVALGELELRHNTVDGATRGNQAMTNAWSMQVEKNIQKRAKKKYLEEEEEEQDEWRLHQVSAKCQAGYALAMMKLTSGNEKDADEILFKMGFKYRLHSKCFSSTTMSETSQARNCQIVDSVLPTSVLQHLRNECFAPESHYWNQHQYQHPACQYFSYSYDLSSQPRDYVEAIIKNYLVDCVAKYMPHEGIHRAEWWVHKRDPMSGHQMHYDLDESRLRLGKGVTHPLVSCVLYLSEGASGAPTLVTSQTLLVQDENQDENDESVQGELVFPKENRLLLFSGDMLHGVVPRMGSDSQIKHQTNRLTLMVGFWKKDQCTVREYDAARPGANMQISDETPQWRTRDGFQKQTQGEEITHSLGESVKIESCWTEVKAKTKVDKEFDQVSEMFIAKYFLKDINDVDQDTLEYAAPNFDMLEAMAYELANNQAQVESALESESQDDQEEQRLFSQFNFCINSLLQLAKQEDDQEIAGEAMQLLLPLLQLFQQPTAQIIAQDQEFKKVLLHQLDGELQVLVLALLVPLIQQQEAFFTHQAFKADIEQHLLKTFAQSLEKQETFMAGRIATCLTFLGRADANTQKCLVENYEKSLGENDPQECQAWKEPLLFATTQDASLAKMYEHLCF